MIKVVGIVTLLASSLVVGVFGGGFSSNGEFRRYRLGRLGHFDRSYLSPLTLVLCHTSVRLYPVVMLNSRNWRREVEESGHAVFINICRQG